MTMWIQTYTGKAIDFSKSVIPLTAISLADIGHSLAMQCRFNGHCLKFYSVAEHSVHVANRVDESWKDQYGDVPPINVRQWALLHDAAEAYVGDMVRPLKHSGKLDEFRKFEMMARSAIEHRLVHGRPSETVKKKILHADLELLATERDQIMAPPPQPWDPLPDPLEMEIHCMSPERAFFFFVEAAKERDLIGKG